MFNKLSMPTKTKCLLCARNLQAHQLLIQLILEDSLCDDCRRSLKTKRRRLHVHDLKITSWMMYDDFFKDCLIQYKECMDEALQDVFLFEIKDWIRLHYFNCVFVVAPSSQQALERRGFQHVEKMFECCGIPFVHCFEKLDDITQKKGSATKRQQIKQHLILHKELIPLEKKLVLIDDVATTASTLLAMQEMLGKKRCKEALVVAIHPKLLQDFDKKCRFFCIY